MDKVQISVKREVFERLQALAEPLIDDASSVIERLVKHWETWPPCPAAGEMALADHEPQWWRIPGGKRLLVGTKLRARYAGYTFDAAVVTDGIEFNGRTYNSPRSAAIAANNSIGTFAQAARTSGLDFWAVEHVKTKRWVSIDSLEAAGG